MVYEFRFLVICLNPQLDEEKWVTLDQVVDTVCVPSEAFPYDLKLHAVVGAVIRSPMWGKCLDLMAWQLDKTCSRESLVGYRGTPLIVPEVEGPSCMPYPVNIPVTSPGFYGFDLFDREGIFGRKEFCLATYIYYVGEA